MSYPREHMLFVVSGYLGTDRTSPFEKFSLGMRFIPAGATPMAEIDTDQIGSSLAHEFQRVWRTPQSGVTDMAQLVEAKWNRIDVNGKYSGDNTRVVGFDPATGFGGGLRGVYLPPQCSLAVTLRTGKTRGLARWGRFYLPAPGFQADNNTGTIGKANQLSVANAWGGFLDGLAIGVGSLSIGLQAVVMSKGKNGTGPGAFNRVTSVEVGGVIDTIRSRRADIPEDYATYQFGVV